MPGPASGDDFLHHLVGAAVDAADPHVGVQPRDRVFVHEAIAAVQLQAFVDDAATCVGRPPFRHRRGGHVELTFLQPGDAIVDEGLRHPHLRLAFGQLESRVLQRHEWRTEHLAVAHVGPGLVDGAPHAGHGTDRDQQAFARQLLHQLREALAFLAAQQIRGRHPHAVEKQFGRVEGLLAHLVEQGPAPEALGALGLHHQQGHAFGASISAGLHGDANQARMQAIGDERLGPVDAPAIAIELRLRLDPLQVGAGARLGHGDRGHQLAAGHARQPALLLRLGAIGQDVMRDDTAVHVVAERLRHAVHLLFADHGFGQEAAAATAVFLGDARAQQARSAGLVPDLAIGVVLAAPARLVRDALALEETPRAVAQHLQVGIHPRPCGHGRPPNG
jgi:hypothetical protein